MYSVTQRYVFVIEYCCQPAGIEGQPGNCHGWVRFRSSKAQEQLQKPFKDISDIPQVINEIISLE